MAAGFLMQLLLYNKKEGCFMRKRMLSIWLCLMMVMSILPTVSFAAESDTAPEGGAKIYVDAVNGNDAQTDVGTTAEKAYKTLATAVTAAKSGDTIVLGEGKYTLYGVNSEGHTKGKDLTFVGQGADKTEWYIGSPTPDQQLEGSEYNGDYSFDGCENITFQKIKFNVYPSTYKGFIRIDNVVLDECEINGFSTYWGYQTTTFRKTVFNCSSDYALWYYTGHEMTFDGCTFNNNGKIVHAYREGTAEKPLVLNFKDCTVNNTVPNKQVLNIKDSNNDYIVNISGNNTVTGVEPNETTCSRWFQVQSIGKDKSHYATVNIDGTPVWAKGEMLTHKYSAGEQDNAFEVTYGEWSKNPNGTKTRTVTKTCDYCGYQENTTENAEADPIEWNVSRSKTATALDTSTWTSNVTLSLPSAEENLASDVVFVLDGSSSANTDVVKNSLALLERLKDSASDSGAAVNVCVVKFKRQAFKSDWYDLSKDFDDIKAAMGTKYSGGTNIHAGLLAGKEALEDHANVLANHKYLILVSDGSTYLYSKDGNWASDTPFTRSYYTKENYQRNAGGFSDNAMWEPNNYPEVNVARPKTTSDVAAWQAYLNDVKERNAESNGDDYDYHCNYDLNFNQSKPSADFKSQPCVKRSANNRDMAFYYADQVWQQMKSAGYHLFSIATKDGSAGDGNADDSHCFMNYLNEGKSLNFNDIQNDILFAVSAGSKVTDTIGEKFTFGGVDSFTLKVGTEEIKGVKDASDKNTVNFGNPKSDGSYPYTVTYTPATKTFVWTINEHVSNFAPVQLTYTVKLTKPETAPGAYGTEDLKGEKDVPADKALFTNERAVLNAKNSAGATLKPLDFPKPSVSYTVKKSSGGGGGGGSHKPTVTIPDDVPTGLNGDDHYAYIVGYPDSTVRPQNGITRAEVATIFFRLLTDETRNANSTKTNSYSDVAAGAWYNHAVSTLSAMGIVKGDSQGKFNPNAPITRAEFAAIAARFDDKANTTAVDFSDIASHWAKNEISAAANNGWINGYTDGTFRPNNKITRAEAMTLVNRVLKRLPETAEDLHNDMIKWSDNSDTSAWYYLAVQEATNSHYYDLKENKHEKWSKLRETRDWTELEK